MRDFYRFQVCWHPHTSSGEALRLACSLAAIGQTTVQVVAPIYPSDAPTGRQRPEGLTIKEDERYDSSKEL